jgi:hypothetical protein
MWDVVDDHHAHDPKTGATIAFRSTPEIELLKVICKIPGERTIRFSIWVESKLGPNSKPGRDNPNVRLYVSDFQRIVRERHGNHMALIVNYRTTRTSSELVRYVIEGLAAICRAGLSDIPGASTVTSARTWRETVLSRNSIFPPMRNSSG